MPKKYRGALAYLAALIIASLAHAIAVESDLNEPEPAPTPTPTAFARRA